MEYEWDEIWNIEYGILNRSPYSPKLAKDKLETIKIIYDSTFSILLRVFNFHDFMPMMRRETITKSGGRKTVASISSEISPARPKPPSVGVLL